ncbi:hypothetical protein [Fictibacillus macauensis]|nr:hypothetical protein [Fictibacillus macauensis]
MGQFIYAYSFSRTMPAVPLVICTSNQFVTDAVIGTSAYEAWALSR